MLPCPVPQAATTFRAPLVIVVALSLGGPLSAAAPLVIAHRGASGYLPEHTRAATALAHAQGSHFIEQDVVLSKDNVPVVLHDVHLDTVSDVAQRFPERARRDGRFYALDFTLEELRTLELTERFDARSGRQVYPRRFSKGSARFSIMTLTESVELIQGLNRTRGQRIGIYPEIKQPAWHRKQGHDISAVVLEVLKELRYTQRRDPIFLQCFDAQELSRIRHEFGSRLRLVQLIGKDNRHLLEPESLSKLARHAQGIGPPLSMILEDPSVVLAAHRAGLQVHAYTVRSDALPKGFATLGALLDRTDQLHIDGLFTDFPDRVVQHFTDTKKRTR